MQNWVKLLIAIALPQIAGGMAALFTVAGVDSWFGQIDKPVWNPPNWIFAPVWTTLYLLMGIAFYLVWKSTVPAAQKKTAMALWMTQLLLNFLWSFLFFNQHSIGWAMVDIVCLWTLILLTIFAFAKINNPAAWLLVPYITWVSFAGVLNYAIWQLNR